jgi:putative two-component system response regulator
MAVVRARVLVVDDDADLRRLLVVMLTHEGFRCAAAGTLAEARAQLISFEPEVALLDVTLAEESGLTLATELKALGDGPAVIMVSAHDDTEIAASALDAGALGYVTKPFTPNDVTIAVDNALRRRSESRSAIDRLRRANEETVRRLAKAVEFRDPDTGAHIERMSRYCALLATHFDLDPELMRVASRLHDVGKIATPDSILLKPGPLTAAERAEMEAHAQIGYELLKGSSIELLDHAATIAWTHHERYDGTGYPRGLAGAEIPLAGRIAAVADAFDALTTYRVYRSALPLDEAVAVLRDERGRHFDPAVVDAFLGDLEAVEAIMAQFRMAAADVPAADVELLSMQRAAETLGITASRLRRWADNGRIEAVRTEGGHRRFPVSEVRRLVAEHERRPAVRPVGPPGGPALGAGARPRAAWPPVDGTRRGRAVQRRAARVVRDAGIRPGTHGMAALARSQLSLRRLPGSARSVGGVPAAGVPASHAAARARPVRGAPGPRLSTRAHPVGRLPGRDRGGSEPLRGDHPGAPRQARLTTRPGAHRPGEDDARAS